MLPIRMNRNFPNVSPIALREAKIIYNLYTILAFLSAIGLKITIQPFNEYVDCGKSQLSQVGFRIS